MGSVIFSVPLVVSRHNNIHQRRGKILKNIPWSDLDFKIVLSIIGKGFIKNNINFLLGKLRTQDPKKEALTQRTGLNRWVRGRPGLWLKSLLKLAYCLWYGDGYPVPYGWEGERQRQGPAVAVGGIGAADFPSPLCSQHK